MAHLSPAAFVDLLDGAVPDAAAPHLAFCVSCQQQLAELRATRQAAGAAGVPEPSPLFWDHLSARVRDAVAAEPVRRARWWGVEVSWRVAVLTSAAAAAVALAAVLLQAPRIAPVPEHPASQPALGETVGVQRQAPSVEDESLGFVADLMGDLDWDAVSELGLASRGGADRAVAEMNNGERVELQRLLGEALAGGV